ncbi:hypothetical protein LRP49_07030 [Enterovibrio sp. ZSDZ35]|uniref:Uncharacterized protein n=1 Tax=Enterovibrio qingdaonensis TaxID=2899818 RepID=A0ABT5QIZ3_9GAMM|nr:hypothetical protein [Enterovibrio sp. ZSDZ35]MDD1780954.1 hypothetical protein [Enterovibrio sp. ZSDZ35]
MKNSIPLIIGLSITGLSVGYMVGGSATPVVSIVIPLIFGLVVTGFGLLQPYKALKDLPEGIAGNQELAATLIDKMEQNAASVKRTLGTTLIFFSLFYLIGTLVGTTARTQQWFAPPKEPTFPWKTEAPKNIKVALDWITLQSSLKSLGYSDEQIEQLYTIQLHELESARNDAETAAKTHTDLMKKLIALLEKKQSATTGAKSGADSNGSAELVAEFMSYQLKTDSSDPFKYKLPNLDGWVRPKSISDGNVMPPQYLTQDFQHNLQSLPAQ